jgi:tetratricopeptide (TPR) repeat protein
MNRLSIMLFVFAGLLAPVQHAFAQRNVGGTPADTVTLSGTVFSENEKRNVNQAHVRLCDPGGNLLEETITTDSGQFNFHRVRRGSYILTIDAAGFQAQTMHLDLSFSSDRGMTIFLNPLENKSPSAGPGSSISVHEMLMPQRARDMMESGVKKLNIDRDAEGALQDFQQALAIAPDYYEAHYHIAMTYLELGKNEEAEKNFRKSIELSEDKYGEGEVGLGAVMLNRGESSQGEKAIRRGLELSPNLWLGHYELGRALLNENKIADAQKSAEQARSLAPNAPIVYRLLSNIHLKEKDYPALLLDLDTYIKLDPDSPAGVRAKEIRQQVAQKVRERAETGKDVRESKNTP